jgi:hypothetical protein
MNAVVAASRINGTILYDTFNPSATTSRIAETFTKPNGDTQTVKGISETQVQVLCCDIPQSVINASPDAVLNWFHSTFK